MSSRSSYLHGTAPSLAPLSPSNLLARLGTQADIDMESAVSALSQGQLKYVTRELLKILDVSGLFVELVDKDLRILYANRTFTERFGYDLDELVGRRPYEFRPPETTLTSCQAITDTLRENGAPWEGLYDRLDKHGSRIEYLVRIVPLRNEEGSVDAYIAVGAERAPTTDELEQLARFAFEDALTGLPNRLLFEDRLRHRIARGARQPETHGALLFLDVDNFKAINDQFGHEAGDNLLIELGARLQASIRSTDTVCRYGGDEFVVLLDAIEHPDDAVTFAARLHKSLGAPVRLLPDVEVLPTASIGITYISAPSRPVEMLIREADTAMYHAKATNSGCVVYDQNTRRSAQQERLIHPALINPTQLTDFELYLRPVTDCRSGEIAELKLSPMWQLEHNTLLPMEQWINSAEFSGKIADIVCWTLRLALAFDDAATSQPYTYRYPLQIPITPRALSDARVRAMISEITLERPLLSFIFIVHDVGSKIHSVATTDALSQIRALGHRIILDHFGLGTLQFPLLTSLPLDGFRVTPKLGVQVAQNRRAAATMRAMQAFAMEAGYTLSATGVDTQESLHWFQRHGWTLVQGNAVGPYMPAARMIDWLTLQRGGKTDEAQLFS